MQTFVATPNSIAMMLQTAIALAVIAVFVMSIVAFLLAIWDFVRSEGEEENKKRWRNRIRYMMIGLVMVIVFLVIFPLLMSQLWVAYYDMFTAPAIFARVSELLNYIFSMGSHVQDFYNTGGAWWNFPWSSWAWNSYTL